MFSYGSGYASSFYSIKFTSSSNLQFILDNLSEVRPKLEQRRKVDPKQFNEILDQKEETCHLGESEKALSKA
jgi:3-hydroxy-3-methylglutaryl CoA synthase